ncbi:reprolysin-like metallopeptidase [Hymenobacter arizonensis]|uniref:Por secretion system C-terminal sorting domain-containing protein n=1 Tax=Hymenobacter arizonensis TaxID=1227077 RepID=A0A1I5UGD4_HYMAR|nr:zinc-dependent metalloprotease family protein [Hymenobacter arizonensis]SFP94343.1 Por secretion system C-terminal sorting domain-containing protein [Hymenobacter arizonensis]
MINYYLRYVADYLREAASTPPRPRHLLGMLGVLLTFTAQAQKEPVSAGFFSDDAAARRAATTSPLAAALTAARSLTLNESGLRTALATAPLEGRNVGKPLVLVLPLPDGTNGRFEVREAPIMAPALAAKFPAIKTYVGVGLDDAGATIRLDLTPRGFHAQVLSAKTGSFFIDPAAKTDTKHYLSFWKQAMPGRSFACEVEETTGGAARTAAPAGAALRTSGPVLRTYRLAMAATGEYTAFQGGTVSGAFAGIVTSVNRVVGVYEKELAVRLVLVPNTETLVYADAATDPYTNANTNNALLAQNQTNIDALIGSANYDIGHVFSTASGGVAGLGVVCRANQKARGTTGTSSPVGDAFDIDYVAHELGHQFGANHTFNGVSGSCGGGNRNTSTAFEPGSGSTIMAYAGICGPANNLQPNSDAYFHVASYDEIQAYLATTSCAATAATGNSPPLITLPASGKTLPIGTPFKLTASAFDPDNGTLSYCWEQFDRVVAGGSPTDAQVDGLAIPLFRSFTPTADPTRYFPRLSSLVANTTVFGERLPTVTRPLRFRVTVRDQNNGSQGTIGGVNSSGVVTLSSTSTAGPFLVTYPNAASLSLAGGSSQAITWDVAGTTANGVNCATVNIRLSTDGGLTYPTLLLSGTANDGSEAVTLPNVATTTARIMVEAADNYFFDISNSNFAITTSAACAAPSSLAISNVTLNSASLSFAGSAASYTIRTEPATTSQTVTGTTATLTGLTAGTTYTVFVQGNCGADGLSAAVSTSFSTTAPAVCNAPTDLRLTSASATSAILSFTPSTSGPVSYTVTTSPATTTQTITGSPLTLTGLTIGTTYTVSIASNCSTPSFSAVETLTFNTQPANDECTSAVALTAGVGCNSISGNVLSATQSQPPSACSGATSSSANDVWYRFVATGSIYSLTASSSFDAVLELFSGSCGSLSSVGCTDEVGPGDENLLLTNLVAGQTYYVRVFPYNGQAGNGDFTLCAQALTNLVVSTPQAIGGTYFNVTVTSTGAATLNDNLNVLGVMTVQNGGSVTTDAVSYYIQGPGRFVLSAGATLIETNTAGITNTGSGAFLLTGLPAISLSTDANYVFAGRSNQSTGALMPRSVRTLTVNNGAALTLTNPVSVAQVVRLQRGNLTLGTRRLLLRSSAAGTALVDNTGGVVNGTTASMQRALTGGVTTGPAYRHFSSPVQAVAFDSLRTGGFSPVVNPAYNTSATPSAVTPFPTVLGYDQDRIATTTSNYSNFDKGWFSPASLSEPMQPNRGYTVNAPATATPVRFTGTFNTGAQSSGTLARTSASDDFGWQLLGNPYPSPLDWSTVAAAQRPGVGAAMYVFQSTGQYAGAYRAYLNGIGGASPLIEAGSGYFVQVATAGTAGAVNLTNANRITTFGPQNAFGRSTADARPQLRLRVAGAGLSDETYLYLQAGATAGIDAEYDAVKLPNSTGLNLASLVLNTQLAIQGLAPLAGTAEVVLPLSLAVPAAGSFTFDAADLANFGTTAVYLRDAADGTLLPLATGTRYAFTLATPTAADGRFAIVLRPATALATQGALGAAQVTVYPNPARTSFTVTVPAVANASRVEAELLNALGQVVHRQSAALPPSGARFAVPTAELATGVYLLRLQTGTSSVTKRVVIE